MLSRVVKFIFFFLQNLNRLHFQGFGKLVYEELMKRLRSVGIRTIYCWADKESEGFWVKQVIMLTVLGVFSSIVYWIRTKLLFEVLWLWAFCNFLLTFQGFIPLAEVDQKGKAKRLNIKSNIRKALCFPGGSTLMLSHLNKESSVNPANIVAGDSVKLGESFGESVYVDCK